MKITVLENLNSQFFFTEYSSRNVLILHLKYVVFCVSVCTLATAWVWRSEDNL